MSAHAIVAEIRSELRTYRRRHRHGDQAVEHEVKDGFCADLERRLSDLVRAIGTVEKRTFGANGESTKRVPFTVVRRARGSRKVLGVAA